MSRLPGGADAATWRHDPVYRFCIRLGLILLGLFRVRVRGTGLDRIPREGGAVLAITHFGYLDFLLTIAALWPAEHRVVRFLATKASFDHPVAGPLMRGMRHVPVDREAGAAAYDETIRRLREGQLVGVFPEAGVSRSWDVKAMKTGAARLAAQAGVPLIPVVVWGGHRIITRGHKISLRGTFGVPVEIRVGEPQYPTPTDKAHAVTQQLRRSLESLVDDVQRTYPGGTPAGAWWVPAALGGSAPTPEQRAAMDIADDEARGRRRSAA